MESYVTSFSALFDRTGDRSLTVSRIEIPLIQRDYAQGRKGPAVERIRTNFLLALREAVDGGESISLDFVYGGVHDGTLEPLDGQQRLTTLFLLHWYLGCRASTLGNDDGWKRFTYATRPSARLFCERLVEHELPRDIDVVSDWVTDQPWYQYTWSHDPTIQSMLVVLDAMQLVFHDIDAEDAWSRLVDPVDPAISFHLLPLDGDALDEDRYIKMNSRGKPLTEFENFKARFEQVLERSCPDRVAEFATKVDGVWADMLWPYHGGDYLVDDEFLRYFHFLTEVRGWRIEDGDDDAADWVSPTPSAQDAERPVRNGVKRPKPESLCGQAWALFDAITAERGEPATISEALERAGDLNHGNLKTEISFWRKFNGINLRAPRPKGSAGGGQFSEEDVAPLAERVFSAANAHERLDFLIRGFDVWVDTDIDAFFTGLFAESSDELPIEKPVIFGSARNVFSECCRKYGEARGRARTFSLPQSLYLYAAIWHRLHDTPDAPRRMRIVRNLIEASGSEIRGERMRGLLEAVERIMSTGSVDGVEGFNQAQLDDEVLKADLFESSPHLAEGLYRLEDEPTLRGSVAAFSLDAALRERSAAFREIIGDSALWSLLSGALLTKGDYFRKLNARFYQFGSPSVLGRWRDLLAGVGRDRAENTRRALEALLDDFNTRDLAPRDRLHGICADFLKEREADDQLDWRYYFVKYPCMREGATGLYVGSDGKLGYSVCMLRKTQMNSYYRDPFALAVYRACGSERLEDPWFYGYEHEPRWLRLSKSGIGLRSVSAGFEVDVPSSAARTLGWERVSEEFGIEDRMLRVAQTPLGDEMVDREDRIILAQRFVDELIGNRL